MSIKTVSIFGSTGSVGQNTIKVLQAQEAEYDIQVLSAYNNVKLLAEQARSLKAKHAVIGDETQYEKLKQFLADTDIEVSAGEEALVEAASIPADWIMAAIVGMAGLRPLMAAIKQGKIVAIANKEPLVMAGGLVLQQARLGGGTVLPLDSEPNAIWQCLKGEDSKGLRRIILTASGGPFFGRSLEQMRDISPAQALDHPTWKMGPKITVDSATLMNKGFEVIEASWLFGVEIEQIDIVVHRQSVVHSLVEFVDGAMLAHMGKTDMLLPIQYALTHPERREVPIEPLDLALLGQLNFAEPDRVNFPSLDLCYEAGRRGGTAPAVLNAANEEAVAAFLAGDIGFLDIGDLNRRVLDDCKAEEVSDLDLVLAEDDRARRQAREWVSSRQ